MDNIQFNQLTKGDRVSFGNQEYGYIQFFGFFTGKHWQKSSRKRANGVFLIAEDLKELGYISRHQLNDYLPALLLSKRLT